ncbi:hypothetical protein NSQ26_05975 [Bacillus sp. FSL W7-1360]
MNKRTAKLHPVTFKHIEEEVRRLKDTKKEILDIKEKIDGITDREQSTVVMTKRLRNLEEIVQAIESAYQELPCDYQNVIKDRYWRRNKLTWDGVAQRNNMHRNTAQKYKNEFIKSVAEKIGWR